jgi:hypothetical protein
VRRILPAVLLLAYVPPSSYVLGEWVLQTKRIQTFHVRQRTTLYDPALPNGSTEIAEEIWIRRPSHFRRSSAFPDGPVNEIVVPGQSVRMVQGRVSVAAPSEILGPLGLLYMPDSQDRLGASLRQVGVAADQSRWVQLGGEVTLEVGAASGDRLRFAKTVWLPTGADLNGRTWRFENSPVPRFPAGYPEWIEVRKNGTLTSKTQVLEVRTGIPLPDSLFDISRLRKTPEKK